MKLNSKITQQIIFQPGANATPTLRRRSPKVARTGKIYLQAIAIFFTFFLSSIIHHPRSIHAQHFESDSYIIDMGNFNMTGGRKSSTRYRLTDTVGEMTPGRFTSDGYLVKSGFQYIHDTLAPFSFRVNDLSIELGTLIPNIGSTDTNIITITAPSGKGYQIMAIANRQLSLDNGITIPPTACDDGCTTSSSRPWTDTNSFGFGFNAIGINSSGAATGVGTSNYFLDQTYYRPFASLSTSPSEEPQIIMSENSTTKDHSARISYKSLISPVQSAGSYENAIIFIAVPKY